jgi:precorrin-6B methylase 2
MKEFGYGYNLGKVINNMEDLQKLSKAQLIKMINENTKLVQEQEKNKIFIKGAREKDEIIETLKTEVNRLTLSQLETAQNIQSEIKRITQEANAKIKMAVEEISYAQTGMLTFMEESDLLIQSAETNLNIVKSLHHRIKKIYVEEDASDGKV